MTEAASPLRIWSWLRSPSARRLLALVTVAFGTAALSMEYTPQTGDDLKVGDVAGKSVRASSTFPFKDWEATLARQRKAEAEVQPVFDFDATLVSRLNSRISGAFETARLRQAEALDVEVLQGNLGAWETGAEINTTPRALSKNPAITTLQP